MLWTPSEVACVVPQATGIAANATSATHPNERILIGLSPGVCAWRPGRGDAGLFLRLGGRRDVQEFLLPRDEGLGVGLDLRIQRLDLAPEHGVGAVGELIAL